MGELGGGSDWTGRGDRPRHAPGVPLLSEVGQDPRQGLDLEPVDQVGGARTRPRVKAHVQGSLLAKGKTSLRVVELIGRESEIEQDTLNGTPTDGPGNLGHPGIRCLTQFDAAAKPCQAPRRPFESRGIEIEAEELAVGSGCP
jgi:hypothetical protein